MKIRSFLAFDLSDEVKQTLANIIAVLEPKVNGVRWMKPAQIHCTIKFFGDVEEELLLGNVSAVIEQETLRLCPIKLKGAGIGMFPNWRYPRVIWAGLAGDIETVIKLHDRLEEALEPFGFQADKRKFRLHLTLGRAKSALKDNRQLVSLVEKMADKEFGQITVTSLTLYKSVLTKDGSIYTALREFPFRGS